MSGTPSLADSKLKSLIKVAPERVLAVIADSVQAPKAIAATLRATTGYGVVLIAESSDQEAQSAQDRRAIRPGLANEDGSTSWDAVPDSIEVVERYPDAAGERLLDVGNALLRIFIRPPDASDLAAPHRTMAEMRSIPVLYFDQYLSLVA
jgi:hypothetical protein